MSNFPRGLRLENDLAGRAKIREESKRGCKSHVRRNNIGDDDVTGVVGDAMINYKLV